MHVNLLFILISGKLNTEPIHTLALNEITDDYTDTDCSGTFPPEYKTGIVGVNNQDNISLYPTLLSAGHNTVTIETNHLNLTDLTLNLYGIDGRLLANKVINTLQSGNNIQIELPIDISGSYIIKLTSGEGNINEVFKITKQ